MSEGRRETGARLLLRDLDSGVEEVVDGRQIRHLLQDDEAEETVVLVGGDGRQYAADLADWERVKHCSKFYRRETG